MFAVPYKGRKGFKDLLIISQIILSKVILVKVLFSNRVNFKI